MGSSLGRVLDPSALDACAGPRARLRIEVPEAWLAEGAELAVTAPARLACAHCDGGGCDACARSGALRAPAGAGERAIRVTLPRAPALGGGRAITIRIPRPFASGHPIDQLLLEVGAAEAASEGVVRLSPAAPLAPSAAAARAIPLPVVILTVIATILWLLYGR